MNGSADCSRRRLFNRADKGTCSSNGRQDKANCHSNNLVKSCISINGIFPLSRFAVCSAGSETTAIIGQTKDGVKTTQKSLTVLPNTIIYDVDLTMTLSIELTVTSGINAIAHAVEALYAADANPITDMQASEGIKSLARALPILRRDPQNREARYQALYGAWLCAICPSATSMALHHKLCHTVSCNVRKVNFYRFK